MTTILRSPSAESVDEAILEINNVIDDLRNTQNCDHVENEEHQCSICFMEFLYHTIRFVWPFER
jgi:hypothetical protein